MITGTDLAELAVTNAVEAALEHECRERFEVKVRKANDLDSLPLLVDGGGWRAALDRYDRTRPDAVYMVQLRACR